jgi:hypothetical protein
MDSFEVVLFWSATVFFGIWTGLGIAQTFTGQFMFGMLNPRVDWSANEIRFSGVTLAVCGFAGAVSGLVFELYGPFGVGTPWFLLPSPWSVVFLGTLVVQVLIDQHHRGRWPFRPRSST